MKTFAFSIIALGALALGFGSGSTVSDMRAEQNIAALTAQQTYIDAHVGEPGYPLTYNAPTVHGGDVTIIPGTGGDEYVNYSPSEYVKGHPRGYVKITEHHRRPLNAGWDQDSLRAISKHAPHTVVMAEHHRRPLNAGWVVDSVGDTLEVMSVKWYHAVGNTIPYRKAYKQYIDAGGPRDPRNSGDIIVNSTGQTGGQNAAIVTNTYR